MNGSYRYSLKNNELKLRRSREVANRNEKENNFGTLRVVLFKILLFTSSNNYMALN